MMEPMIRPAESSISVLMLFVAKLVVFWTSFNPPFLFEKTQPNG